MERKRKYSFILCLIISAIVPLLICSKCSPMYPFNDWYDINMFFTLGKGMVQGAVPYRDLLEQKGPYVFLFSAIAYLFTNTSFLGYFILECIAMIAMLYFAVRTIELYVEFSQYWLLPILVATITCSRSFTHGGSAEELLLGIFAYALYSALRAIKSEEKIVANRTILINGVCAGIILWSKFNMLGIYAVWVTIFTGIYLYKKRFKELMKASLLFVTGVAISTIPWIVYFGFNDAINEWMKAYVFDNIFLYSVGVEASVKDKVLRALQNIFISLKWPANRMYAALILLGGMWILFSKKERIPWGEKLAILFLGIGLSLGIFIGGTLQDYYILPLTIFATFGVAAIVFGLEKFKCMRGKASGEMMSFALGMVGMVLSVWICFKWSSNIYLLGTEKQEMPQYRFAEIIQQSEDTSVLNYGFLDGGFYTVLNQVPTVQVFCIPNIRSDEYKDEQRKYIEEQLTNWVVAWNEVAVNEEVLMNQPILSEYYELVDYQHFYCEEDIRTYSLYKRR